MTAPACETCGELCETMCFLGVTVNGRLVNVCSSPCFNVAKAKRPEPDKWAEEAAHIAADRRAMARDYNESKKR